MVLNKLFNWLRDFSLKVNGPSNNPLPSIPEERLSPQYWVFFLSAWGVLFVAIFCFCGYAYLCFYDRELGIQMGGLSSQEGLMYCYDVVNIQYANFFAMIWLLSLVFTLGLLLILKGKLIWGFLERIGHLNLFWIIPFITMIFLPAAWHLLRATFQMAEQAGVAQAKYVKTHLDEQKTVVFTFAPETGKSLPVGFLEANDKKQFRLIVRTQQGYCVMRKLEKKSIQPSTKY